MMSDSNAPCPDPRLPACARIIDDLEREMRRSGLWETEAPSPEAFDSVLPFSVDTMSLVQWLQWVFIPRTRAVMDRGGPLPADSAIRPLADEVFAEREEDTRILRDLIGEFDRLINKGYT